MPNIYHASIEQNDCPHTMLTSKHKGLTIFIMNAYKTGSMQQTFSLFYSPSRNIISSSLTDLGTYPGMTDIVIMGKKNNLVSLAYSFPRTSAYKTVSSLGFRIHPVIVKDGIEKWFFISSSDEVTNMIKEKISDEKTRLISIEKLYLFSFDSTIFVP